MGPAGHRNVFRGGRAHRPVTGLVVRAHGPARQGSLTMSPDQRNQQVHNALDQWLRDGQIDMDQHARIGERYVLTRWDWRSLGRWFLTFGAISLARSEERR